MSVLLAPAIDKIQRKKEQRGRMNTYVEKAPQIEGKIVDVIRKEVTKVIDERQYLLTSDQIADIRYAACAPLSDRPLGELIARLRLRALCIVMVILDIDVVEDVIPE